MVIRILEQRSVLLFTGCTLQNMFLLIDIKFFEAAAWPSFKMFVGFQSSGIGMHLQTARFLSMYFSDRSKWHRRDYP